MLGMLSPRETWAAGPKSELLDEEEVFSRVSPAVDDVVDEDPWIIWRKLAPMEVVIVVSGQSSA